MKLNLRNHPKNFELYPWDNGEIVEGFTLEWSILIFAKRKLITLTSAWRTGEGGKLMEGLTEVVK
jgi:hypothetical protein